jgi:dihydroorotase
MRGTEMLECELTLRDGAVLWDLNGLAGDDWEKTTTVTRTR